MRIQVLIGVLFVGLGGLSQATDYYYYADPAFSGHFGARHYYENELSRLRRDLRTQQRLNLREDERLNETLNGLRRSLENQSRLSAEQACYYRMTGGFEACEDMFADGSDGRLACEDSVRQRNPGCAI